MYGCEKGDGDEHRRRKSKDERRDERKERGR